MSPPVFRTFRTNVTVYSRSVTFKNDNEIVWKKSKNFWWMKTNTRNFKEDKGFISFFSFPYSTCTFFYVHMMQVLWVAVLVTGYDLMHLSFSNHVVHIPFYNCNYPTRLLKLPFKWLIVLIISGSVAIFF